MADTSLENFVSILKSSLSNLPITLNERHWILWSMPKQLTKREVEVVFNYQEVMTKRRF